MSSVVVYGKEQLGYNSTTLKNLYLQGVERVKLNRGKWYDICYSGAQKAYYARVSMIQREV